VPAWRLQFYSHIHCQATWMLSAAAPHVRSFRFDGRTFRGPLFIKDLIDRVGAFSSSLLILALAMGNCVL